MRHRQVETGKLVARIITSTIGEWIGRAEVEIIKGDIRLLEHLFQPLRKLMNKTE